MTIEATTEWSPRGLTFAKLLEDTRENLGISKAEAARRIGTSVVTYRNWIRGQVPGYEQVDRLAEFVGLHPYVIQATLGRMQWDDVESLIPDYAIPINPGYFNPPASLTFSPKVDILIAA